MTIASSGRSDHSDKLVFKSIHERSIVKSRGCLKFMEYSIILLTNRQFRTRDA